VSADRNSGRLPGEVDVKALVNGGQFGLVAEVGLDRLSSVEVGKYPGAADYQSDDQVAGVVG